MCSFPLTLQDLCYGKDANANGHGCIGKVDGGTEIELEVGKEMEMEK